MKLFYSILLSIFILTQINAQTIIKMEKVNGVFMMPCKVNGLSLKFIFDTGASDVSISLTEALFMLKNGYLDEKDLIGTQKYQIANGDIQEGTKIILRQIEIGQLKLHDVKASVLHSLSAPLLLGQSALCKLGKIEFDYSNNTLKINNGTLNKVNNNSNESAKKQTSEEYINSGRKKVALKDYQGAMEDFNNAIGLNPSSDTAYANIGLCKSGLEDYKGAIQDYNKAIELNPKLFKAYYGRGLVKYKLEDYYGAIQDNSKAIELNPNFAEAYINIGLCKHSLKDYRGAIQDYTKAIELDSKLPRAYFNRGYSKHKLEDYKEAIQDYNNAIELDPKFAQAYFNRGACKYGLKDKEGSCTDWSKAGELGSTEAYDRISKYCK